MKRTKYTRHARQRHRQWTGQPLTSEVMRLVKNKLADDLYLGMKVVGEAVEVDIGKVRARCVPCIEGGWAIVTFVPKD